MPEWASYRFRVKLTSAVPFEGLDFALGMEIIGTSPIQTY